MRYNRVMPVVDCLASRQFSFTIPQTVLLVIDMQQDFFGPDGGALRPIIPRVASVLAAARRAGLTIIHTREGYAADGHDVNPYKRHLGYVGRPGPNGPFLVRGSQGHDFLAGLAPLPGEAVIDKAGFSGFYQTDLHERLQKQGISHLILQGVTSQCCVHSTLRDAVERGYFCLTLTDCCAAEDPAIHEATLQIIQAENHLFGWLAASAALLSVLPTG